MACRARHVMATPGKQKWRAARPPVNTQRKLVSLTPAAPSAVAAPSTGAAPSTEPSAGAAPSTAPSGVEPPSAAGLEDEPPLLPSLSLSAATWTGRRSRRFATA